MNEVKLLDCPFCGESGQIEFHDPLFFAGCVDLECQGGWCNKPHESEAKAIAAWNTRPTLVTGQLDQEQSSGGISGSREPDPSFTGSGPSGFDPGRWQPIATAPRNSDVLIAGEEFVTVGDFDCDCWSDRLNEDEPIFPTHWMPLPEPPERTGA